MQGKDCITQKANKAVVHENLNEISSEPHGNVECVQIRNINLNIILDSKKRSVRTSMVQSAKISLFGSTLLAHSPFILSKKLKTITDISQMSAT